MSIENYIDIDDTLFEALEDAITNNVSGSTLISGSTVPVKFFNRQSKFKEVPAYPSIIIQPLEVKEWGEGISVETDLHTNADNEDQSLLFTAPVWMIFEYQVSIFSKNWIEYRELQRIIGQRAVPEREGVRYLVVGDYTRSVELERMPTVPSLSDSVFQDVYMFRIRIPIYQEIPDTVYPITGFTIGVSGDTSISS